ncbi:T9SS C-terminal target domain-containing protein [Sphingobacteriales bacterium UPWRP_1]|nr:hypothetical protein BVG80_13115 [Sphingobacteriales bacterium TSM_CSM]PSJ73526.1 T9SS C-terminal target domain-containing protein [Sphingobacteriales bacterium UPWRP_1]
MGCTATDQVTVTVSTVTAIAGENQTICPGTCVLLSASGGGTYVWSTGATSPQISVGPSSATTYTVTVTNTLGCTDIDVVTVYVGGVVADAGADQTICTGANAVLTASGGGSYEWSTGQTGASITVSPQVTTTYSVMADGGSGCDAVDYVTVYVVDQPTANAGANSSICLGESTMLTASGGGTYQWSNGQTSGSITVSPTSTTTYTVTVSNTSGCTDTDSVTVTVSQTEADAGPDVSICAGECVNLSASGGVQYSWSNGQTSGHINVSPSVTTTYTVTVTGANGCTDTDAVTVTVLTATANAGADQTICEGGSAVLTASGGGSYLWSTGATTSSITVSPGTTTTYAITVTNANGCEASDYVTVTVAPGVNANAGANMVICAGSSATLSATGGSVYQWSNGQTGATISVSPVSTTTYTVIVSNAGGCSATDAVTVVVGGAITANAGDDETTCAGECVMLSASGGTIYHWSTGDSGASISVSPVVSTTYIVTVSDAYGCSDTDAVFVTVTDCTPPPPCASDTTICGQPVVTQIVCPNFCQLQPGYTITEASTTFNCGLVMLSQCIQYTPLPGMAGLQDIIVVTACDAFTCQTITITAIITEDGNCNEPQPPVANNDSAQTNSGTPVWIDITANDVANGTTLTIASFTQPQYGTVTVSGNGLQYVPDAGFEGVDLFTYQICNEFGLCDDAQVSVQVNAGCDEVLYVCTSPLTPITFCPEFCNIGADIAILSASTTYNCSINMLDNTCFQYTSLPLFVGEETISVIGCNTAGQCDTLHIIVQVGDCDGGGMAPGNNDGGGNLKQTPLQVWPDEPVLKIQTIAPSPATAFTTVYFSAGYGQVVLEVYDLFGKQYLHNNLQTQGGMNMCQLPVNALPSGTYLAHLKTPGGQQASAKFVKQ